LPNSVVQPARSGGRVVIVGAGLGGCMVAHALAATHEVTVVELGTSVGDMQERLVDTGRGAGLNPHIGSGLGGTTELWHNALIEIEEEIFRDHWPFPKSELAPWYEAAYRLLSGAERSQVLQISDEVLRKYQKLGIVADIFQPQYCPSTRRNLWQSLRLNGRVTLVRGEVHGFRADHCTIRSVLVKTGAGEREIEGDSFVLAAGGIGTPILLECLAEEVVVPSLSNGGRFYEDHPIGFVGQATIPLPLYRYWNYPAPGGSIRFLHVVRQEGLHFSFQLRPAALQLRGDRAERMGSIITKLRNQMWNPINWIRLLTYWDDVLDIISMKFGIRIPTSHYSIFMQAGMRPSEERSISRSLDAATGRNVIHRKWVLSEADLATVRDAIENFAGGLRAVARSVTILSNWSDALTTSAHHSGTARVSRTPGDGACDADGRIHGLENIFIADGSAVPASGIANTGLTIAALGLRLADHIQRMGRPVQENGPAVDVKTQEAPVPGEERPRLCLLTGATGFIGTRFCERANRAGTQRFRALVRSNDGAFLVGPAVETVQGDLLNPESISRALEGCDAVVHLAHGENHLAATATRNLVEAACRAGVQRFVHISSMSVHGPAPGPEAACESTARIGRYNEEYCDSKAEEEEIVQRAMDSGSLAGVILRPTVVYGPSGGFVKLVLDEARTGTVTVIDDGAGVCNAVFIDDVCDAIDAAIVSREALGKAMFITADEAVTWGTFIQTFADFIEPPAQVNNISSAEADAWWTAHPPSPQPGRRSLFSRALRKAARMVLPEPSPPPFPARGRIMRETVQVTFLNGEAKRLLGWIPKTDFAAGAAEIRTWLDNSR
jgi:nucleoside-diphosphate-sugar epimerase